MKKRDLLLALVFVFPVLATESWAASEKVLYNFKGGADGAYPSSPLLIDSAGNLYGTTSTGGSGRNCPQGEVPGCGVIYKLVLVNGGWQQNVIYTFQGGSDGAYPVGNLVFGAFGNLYGAAEGGGVGGCLDGCGVIYELSPNPDGDWVETVVYSFQVSPDGLSPLGLTADTTGNLYGTTFAGGANDRGAVFELSPPAQKGGPWTEKIIYNLRNDEIEFNPGLVFDGDGNLYGTYFQQYDCYVGCGAVFQLKPLGGSWQEADIVDLPGGGNGGEPMAPVIVDDQGNVYGTASIGGNNFGTVFEISPHSGHWKPAMLYNFCGRNQCSDGINPYAGLVRDASGVLYGTTSGGYVGTGPGVVFKLVHTKYGWRESVLHTFSGGSDGSRPEQSLILDGQGNLYGTTNPYPYGQNVGYGTVFEVTP